MLKVYLAGKITGDPNYREKFQAHADILTACGDIALNPAVLPAGMKEADYMRICLAMIDCADAVVLLPDWKESSGAIVEKLYAEKTGKSVIDFPKL